MAIKMTREEYQQIYGQSPVTSGAKPQAQGGVNLGISDAFKGGISQAKAGYEQSKNATNPLQFIEGGVKSAAGAFGAAFSPLAPLMKPIEKGVEFAADKISDIPAVQKFAGSKAGEVTLRVAEDVGNVAGVVGGVAGGMTLKPAVKTAATNVAKPLKPAIAGVGRTLKATGEGSYGITTTLGEGTARAMQTYKESTPNLMSRIKNTVSGEMKGKPITEANTAARFGLMGTEQEIGVQAGRYMNKTWTDTIQPALAKSKGTLEMRKFFDAISKKISKETPELSRRADLLEGLEALKDQYKNVSRVKLEKLQDYKAGWTQTLPESSFKGKPIAGSLKEVKKVASDIARDFIHKNIPEEAKQAYIDYGNLKSIREAGIKSGVGDLAKKSIGRGAWQFVMDKAVTPVATTMGKILYRTGEGLEFVGESGAKKVGDIIGDKPNPQSGMVKNPFAQEPTQSSIPKQLEPLATEAQKYKSAEEYVKAKTTRPDYGYGHSPNEDGVRAFDLTEKVDGEQMIPSDMYEQWYGSRGTPEDLESIAVLKKIKGNPEADVTIYRASPKDEWNYGDWTTLSKKYAQSHAEGNTGFKVFSKVVKAKDVRWAMDDVNEFGYFPENYKSQLTDIWKKANTK